ncbi:MAG: hypothetical protein Q8R11_03980 [bacterium]|nr:hypothetical protein [bacterium]
MNNNTLQTIIHELYHEVRASDDPDFLFHSVLKKVLKEILKNPWSVPFVMGCSVMYAQTSSLSLGYLSSLKEIPPIMLFAISCLGTTIHTTLKLATKSKNHTFEESMAQLFDKELFQGVAWRLLISAVRLHFDEGLLEEYAKLKSQSISKKRFSLKPTL